MRSCVFLRRNARRGRRDASSSLGELGPVWLSLRKTYVATQGEQHSSKAYLVSKGGGIEDTNVDTRDLLSTDAA
jgi:hypothetical protein